jgi:hypothetical protein
MFADRRIFLVWSILDVIMQGVSLYIEHSSFIGLKTCICWDLVTVVVHKAEKRKRLQFAIH